MKTFLTILILIFAFQLCSGQEIDFKGNWYREILGYDDAFSAYDFRYYTKDDVIKAKGRFDLIKQYSPKDEWEGVYTSETGTGISKLYWNSGGGFVKYYVYHTLASLDFGTALANPDSVKLLSEKSLTPKRKSSLSSNLIKVIFGAKHFLVPENRLKDFAKEAAGLNIDHSDFFYYWWKDEDSEKEVNGLLILPQKYSSFLRYPIKTKIIKMVNQEVIQSKNSEGKLERDAINYFFTIDAGKNKGLKKGMKVYIFEMKEWAEVDKVSQSTSIAYIQRQIGSDNKEICTDRNYDKHKCGTLSVGMTAQTLSSIL